MRKNYIVHAVLLLCCCLPLWVSGQTTINTTVGSTGFDGGNSLSNNYVTFVIDNTSSTNVLLTDIGQWSTTSQNGATYTLYYSSTSLSGAPPTTLAAPDWNVVATNSASGITATGVNTVISGMSFLIPANTTYRFALHGSSTLYYSGTNATIPTPNTFTSSGVSLHVGNYQIGGSNVGYGGSANTPRSFTGSITFVPALPCVDPPTPGTAIVDNANPCAGSTVELSLQGQSSGTGQTYLWQTGPTSNGPWTNISTADPSSILLTPVNTTAYYRAEVTCGSSATSTAHSTPVLVTVPPLFPAGTYTIGGPAGPSNFATFADAANAISCGIAGPVVFNVTAGTYTNDQFILGQLNSTATNNITINGNGATMSFLSTNTNERGAIQLNGADHVTVSNLNIIATGSTTSEYGSGVYLTNDADSNTFSGLNITLDTTIASSNYIPIVISGATSSPTTSGSNCDGNTFSGNTLNGGYYGVVAYGNSSTPYISNNTFTNNVIKNYYAYGFYVNGNHNTLIEGNDLSRPTRTNSTTFAGIYMNGSSTAVTFNANRIHNAFDAMTGSTSSAYPLYCVADATAADPIIFSNNLIYDINNSGTIYGVYNSGAAYNKYYHNTISLDDLTATTSSATRGIYQVTNVQGIEFMNNIVSIKRGGSGTNYGIYKGTAATPITANYNNYFIAGSGTNHIGYEGGSETTLADWQTASGQDLNSSDLAPLFSSATDFTPGNSALDNTGTPVGITADIMNATRSTTTPDMGAYEFTIPPCFGTPTAGTAFINGASSATECNGGNLALTLQGFSTGAGITIQWQSSPMGQFAWTNIPGATTPTFNTTFTGAMDYQAVVICLGAQSTSNVVTATLSPFYFCYCSPNTGTTLHGTTSNYITNVTIPNTSLNHATTSVGSGGYTFADPAVATNTATLSRGVPYTIDATHSSTSASVNNEVWIDWDQSGTFDATEYYTMTTSSGSSSTTITVPATAMLGNTGMRIRAVFSTSTTFGSGGACSNISVGRETQDYVVTIAPAPTCFPPTGLTAPVVSYSGATIEWLASNPVPGNGYDYYYSTANTNPTAATTPSGSVGAGILTAGLSGLTPATPYYVWVRGNCGANDYSTWTGPLMFTTACAPFTAPYTHDVESQVANTSSTMNNCWTSNPSASSVFAWHVTGTGTTGSASTGPSSAHSGSKYFFTEASNGSTNDVATLTTPLVDVTGLTAPMLEFWYHMYGATINKMVVEVFDGTTWNAVDSLIGEQQTSETDPWLSRMVPLTGYTGPIQARFVVTRGTGLTGDISLDDISIMQAPSCLPPTGVSISPVAATTATVNWTASTTPPGVGYDYYYNTTNTAPTSTTTPTGSTGPTVTTANLTGLTPITTYYLWVRTDCAANDQSTWSGPEVFTTACAPFTAPYTHDVESQVANTTSTMNGCWTSNPSAASVFAWHVTGTGTTGSLNTGPSTAHSGSKYFFTESSNGTTNDVATLTTPLVNVTGLTSPMLEYWYHMYGATTNKMVVEVFDGTTWNPVDSLIGEQQTSETAPWLSRSIVLNGYTGPIQARFVVTRGTSFTGDVSLDDISIMQAPSCPAPSAPTSVTTTSSATLSWTEQGTATQWQIEYGAPGFTQGTGTSVFTNTNPYLLSGLPGATQYGFYVRSICGPNDTSAWTGPTLFATIPPNDTCTNAADITDGLVHTGTTAGATETMTPCDATTATANDVWYSFTTGSVGGTVTVTVITTGSMDVVIQGFSGTCGSLTGMVPTASTTLTGTCIDGPAAGTEFGDFTVAPNTTYYIRVYGFNSLQGTFTIQAVGTPLAIKLESIQAVNVGSRNRIDWTTASEELGDYFEIERSSDGRNYTKIATVPAKGEASAYSYWDASPVIGRNHYRLNIKDASGNGTYSREVVAIVKAGGEFSVVAHPNPVSDKLQVTVYGVQGNNPVATVMDVTGKLISTVKMMGNTAEIDMSGLAQGAYIIRYTDANHAETIKVNKR